ncbi:MAG: aldo/keto reductase [Coriobacteriales bacterium]|jgi:predicted aldo/keto reductase-like oxidoreductase
MLYNDFKGLKISALGMGAMRLPTKGDYENVDQDKLEEIVAYAMENGVNYYDSGWDYHGGNSEGLLAKALSNYPRDSYSYATKFPGYDTKNFGKVEEIFEEQLKRTGLDHFDFYLLHNVCELNINQFLNGETYHTVEYLLKMKEEGKITHFGFSSHGNPNTVRRFLDKYGDYMEFCQLQVNWLDWEFQKTRQKYEICTERGLPVISMEPLRGGKLVNRLSDEDLAKMRELRPDITPVEWSFRFIQGIPNILTVLSGFSELGQVKENIETFKESKPLNEQERQLLLDIAKRMTTLGAVPCTSCRYCASHCPQHLDIPWLIELYNEDSFSGGGFIAPMAIGGLPEDRRPEACISCKSCEEVCPQGIEVSVVLKKLVERIKDR